MYIYAEIATSGVNNWAILRDWYGGVLTKLVISYPILELASIFWYHWMCNIQEGTIHMLTYSYTERNQPQRIKIRATPTFLVCLSPRVKCTQHPVWCRSLTFMLCSLYSVYLGCITANLLHVILFLQVIIYYKQKPLTTMMVCATYIDPRQTIMILHVDPKNT